MPLAQQQLEALRAARAKAIDRLTDHFERDDLDVAEYETRLGRAHRAETVEEVDRLFADLPATEPTAAAVEAQVALTPRAPAALAPARQTGVAVAVMSGARRHGDWTPPRRLWAVAFMGGVELDFREARLPPGVTDVDVVAVMGGVEIIVPPQLAVDVRGFGFMGGFEEVERAPAIADPDVPVLRVRGFALMGGVEVHTRLPGESAHEARRRVRQEARAAHREERDRARGR